MPRSPRATITRSVASVIASKLSRPSWFSILEMILMLVPPPASRHAQTVATSAADWTNLRRVLVVVFSWFFVFRGARRRGRRGDEVDALRARELEEVLGVLGLEDGQVDDDAGQVHVLPLADRAVVHDLARDLGGPEDLDDLEDEAAVGDQDLVPGLDAPGELVVPVPSDRRSSLGARADGDAGGGTCTRAWCRRSYGRSRSSA